MSRIPKSARWDRIVYQSFLWITGASYFVIGWFSWENETLTNIWPGGEAWAILYALAGLGTFIAGWTARKLIYGGRLLWLRRAGLILTPALLLLRAAANLAANGVNGAMGSVFLVWAAFVVVWAGALLRRLPTSPDEWADLRHQYEALRHQMRDLRDGHPPQEPDNRS